MHHRQLRHLSNILPSELKRSLSRALQEEGEVENGGVEVESSNEYDGEDGGVLSFGKLSYILSV